MTLLDALGREKMELVADALDHYANALEASEETLAHAEAYKGARIVRQRSEAARRLAIDINRSTERMPRAL